MCVVHLLPLRFGHIPADAVIVQKYVGTLFFSLYYDQDSQVPTIIKLVKPLGLRITLEVLPLQVVLLLSCCSIGFPVGTWTCTTATAAAAAAAALLLLLLLLLLTL